MLHLPQRHGGVRHVPGGQDETQGVEQFDRRVELILVHGLCDPRVTILDLTLSLGVDKPKSKPNQAQSQIKEGKGNLDSRLSLQSYEQPTPTHRRR